MSTYLRVRAPCVFYIGKYRQMPKVSPQLQNLSLFRPGFFGIFGPGRGRGLIRPPPLNNEKIENET